MDGTRTRLDPLFYDIDATEEDASYDRWFRAKVQEALDDTRPGIPHDEAMAQIDRWLEEDRKAHASA